MSSFVRAMPLPGKIKRRDLVEKDLHIHTILAYLREDSPLEEDLCFKGGTCLAKAYLGYYRFSEDVDFTWRHQDEWQDLSISQVKKRCSGLIGEVADHLEVLAVDLGFNFLADKEESDQVGIGSGGRMVTFFLYYDSLITGMEEFIKVQLNFVDDIFNPVIECDLTSFIKDILEPDQLDWLGFRYGEDLQEYSREIRFPCYSARELFIEKCRAILTRKGIKFRDLVDVAMLESRFGYTVEDQTDDIIKKTLPMLGYKRYAENMRNRGPHIPDRIPEREETMLIEPLSPSIEARIPKIYEELQVLSKRIIRSL